MIFVQDSTSQSVDVLIVDDTGLPVLLLVAATFPAVTFSLAGSNSDVAIPLSDLATITSSWSAGGVKERGNGLYRLDLPNSCFTVLGQGTVRGEVTGKHLILEKMTITDVSSGDPLENIVPGTYASGTAGAALGRIGSGQITVTSIVSGITIGPIYIGDSYLAVDGRAIDFTDATAGWPDFTSALSVSMFLPGSNPLISLPMSFVTRGGPYQKVRLELTPAQTAAFNVSPARKTWAVEVILADSSPVRLINPIMITAQ